jgi:hypothetical protein
MLIYQLNRRRSVRSRGSVRPSVICGGLKVILIPTFYGFCAAEYIEDSRTIVMGRYAMYNI